MDLQGLSLKAGVTICIVALACAAAGYCGAWGKETDGTAIDIGAVSRDSTVGEPKSQNVASSHGAGPVHGGLKGVTTVLEHGEEYAVVQNL